MNIQFLQNISPMTTVLFNILYIYFSEWALMRYRIYIEIEYLIKLNKIGLTEYNFTDCDIHFLRNIHRKSSQRQLKNLKKT